MKQIYKIAISAIVGFSIGVFEMVVYQSDVDRTTKEFNYLFLKESRKLPTKDDSVYFYKNHHLLNYIIYEGDKTKTPERNVKLLKIPYSEIERIVREGKK